MVHKFSKYENISKVNAELLEILNQIEIVTKKMKTQKADLKEMNSSKYSMKTRFKELKNEKLIILDKNFNIQLLRAKVNKTDVNKIYDDYEVEKSNTYIDYDEKYRRRISKLELDISDLKKGIRDNGLNRELLKGKFKLTKKSFREQRKIISSVKWESRKDLLELKFKYNVECLNLTNQLKTELIDIEKYDADFLNITNEFRIQEEKALIEADALYLNYVECKKFSIKKENLNNLDIKIEEAKKLINIKAQKIESDYKTQINEQNKKYKDQFLVPKTELSKEEIKKIKHENKLTIKQIKFLRYSDSKDNSVELAELKREKVLYKDSVSSNKNQILVEFYNSVEIFQTRYKSLNAIKMTFLTVFPIVLLGAFVTLFTSVIFSTGAGSIVDTFDIPLSHEMILWMSRIRQFFEVVGAGTSGTISLYIVVVMSYNISKNYNQNIIWVSTVSSVIAFFLLSNNFLESQANFNMTMGTDGMLAAIVLPIFIVKIFAWLDKVEVLKLKLPTSIPDAVAKSLNSLVPMFVLLTAVSFLASVLTYTSPFIDPLLDAIGDGFTVRGAKTLSQVLGIFVSIPMNLLFNFNIILGVIIFVGLSSIIWWCGINSSAILGAFLWGKFGGWINDGFGDSWFGSSFFDHMISLGGTGGTLALIFVVLAFSKRNNWKMISKIAIIPALFCINEPILFGLPLVFNPVLFLPFILAPVSGVLMYVGIHGFGIMDLTIDKDIEVPWTTPPILGAYWATNSWRGSFFAVLVLIVQCAIYTPFVFMDNTLYKITLENQDEDVTFSFRKDALKIGNELEAHGVSKTLESYIDPQADYYD
ncbi:PTS transporter subunit EIIC [Spiroplasma endosymbiont of Othius punctulatus]|uniref:PTS transporter subunit EIIC n=1 Tax=Spiroplasma endosymbiont of Othius punctulatus TaxID=3066289 RepID=UPI0030CCF264